MNDNIKDLYNELKKSYELGSEEEFRQYLSNENNREALRKELEAEYDVGDSASFSSYLGFNGGQAKAKPRGTYAPQAFLLPSQGEGKAPVARPKTSQQPVVAQPSKPAAQPKTSQPKVSNPYKQSNPVTATYEVGEPTKKAIRQDVATMASPEFREKDKIMREEQADFEKRLAGVLNTIDPENAAEAAWANAIAQEQEDITSAAKQTYGSDSDSWARSLGIGSSMTGGFGQSAQFLLDAQVAKLKARDLERMADDAWASLGHDKQVAMIREVYKNLQARFPDADEKVLEGAAFEMARQQSDRRMYELAVSMNAPKNATEYFFRKALQSNMLTMLNDAAARKVAGTTGDWAARDVAEQRFEKESGWNKVAGIGGTVAGMAIDPTMWMSAGVGSAAAKGTMWLGGKMAARKATETAGRLLQSRLAQGAVAGAANFGTFEGAGETLNQLRLGGALEGIDESGNYVIGDYSGGKIAGQVAHGLGMGAVTGVVGGAIGNVSDRVVRATKPTAGKIGERVAQGGVSTVAEGTIFAAPEMISTAREYNKAIAALSDPNSPSYIENERERSKAIAALREEKGAAITDVWTDNQAMILGFKLHGLAKTGGKFTTTTVADRIAKLRGERGVREGFETRLRRALDGQPGLQLTKDEREELKRWGYTDLDRLAEEAKAYKKQQGSEATEETMPYERFAELMGDKRVSEAARAKMYYYLTGNQLPMSTVMGGRMEEEVGSDGNGTGRYLVQSIGANGVITSKVYGNKAEAEGEMGRIERQMELNGIDVGEKYREARADRMRMEEACELYAEANDIPSTGLYEMMRLNPETMSEGQRKWAAEIQEVYERLGDSYSPADIRREIEGKYGVSIDKAIAKEPNRRSEKEQQALDAYMKRLYEGVEQPKSTYAYPDEPNKMIGDRAVQAGYTDEQGRADFGRGYNADGQERRDIYMEEKMEGGKEASIAGVERAIEDQADFMAAQEREQYREMTQADGSLHPAELKGEDENGNKRQVYIIDEGEGSVVVYDPTSGKKEMMAPGDIAERGEVESAEQIESGIEQRRNERVQKWTAEARGEVNVEPGETIDLGDGRKARVLATDAESITIQTEDGVQQTVSREEVQKIADQLAVADYEARHPREAEPLPVDEVESGQPSEVGGQPEVVGESLPEGYEAGEPERYEEGMEVLMTVDGEVKPVTIGQHVERIDREWVYNPESKIIEYTVEGESEPRHIYEKDMADEVVGYKPMEEREEEAEPMGEEEAEEPTEEAPVEETAEAEELDESEKPMPMKQVKRTIDGRRQTTEEEDWQAVSPSRAYQYLYIDMAKQGYSAERADGKVAYELEQAKKALAKAEKDQSGSIQAIQSRVNEAQAVVDYWQEVSDMRAEDKRREAAEQAQAKMRADEQKHAEAVARAEREKAEEEAKRAEAEERGAGAAHPAIREKWEKANKIDGVESIFVAPNGEEIEGKYVLAESGAATPSHDVRNEFADSEGYPVDEKGNNINDRDYKRDRAAAEDTRKMAMDYGSRAVQNVPVVSREGVVLSGNGRTMAGELAAEQNTDGAYIDFLKKVCRQYGFTPEQVESMEHPRLLFVPNEDMPYTTETMAKFNEQDQKSMSPSARALKLGKQIDDELYKRMMARVNRYETMAEFFADDKAVDEVISEMVSAGVYNPKEVAKLKDGKKLSAEGRSEIESAIIGKYFASNPDIVMMLVEMPQARANVLKALQEISENGKFGEDFSLQQTFAEAVKLAYDVQTSGIVPNQTELFGGEGETVADYKNMAMLLLSDVLNDRSNTKLRDVMRLYNNEARLAAGGQADIFSGDVRSKEDILKDIINDIYHGNKKELGARLREAAENRQRDNRGESEVADAGEGDSGSREGQAERAEAGGERVEEEQPDVREHRAEGEAEEQSEWRKALGEGLDEELGDTIGKRMHTDLDEGQQRLLEAGNKAQTMFHKVFHGSGADFEKFDSSHMGEGEGAQAYGYGHYTTEVEGIGRTYAKQGRGKYTYHGKTWEDLWDGERNGEDMAALDVVKLLEDLEDYKTFDEIVADIRKDAEEAIESFGEDPNYKESADHYRDKIAALDKMKREDFERKENYLYTVEIPDDNGSNYIDWTKKPGIKAIRRLISKMNDRQKERILSIPVAKNQNGEEIIDKEDLEGRILWHVHKNGWNNLYDVAEVANGGKYVDNGKSTARLLHSAGFVGVKYPAEFRSGGRSDGAKNYVIFDDKDLQITDKVKFFKTNNGEVYGFTVDGEIYIDPRIATPETRVHEYAHLWAQGLKEKNPRGWEQLKSEMAKEADVIDYVKRLYPELFKDGVTDEGMEEVFAHYSGRRGAERLEREMQEEMAKANGVFEKAQVASVFAKIRDLLSKFWKMSRDLFAGKVRGIEKLKGEDFADMMLGDLLGHFDPGKKNKEWEAKRDREYMEAVERGDMEKAQRMVDDAAERTGYTVDAYHGTMNGKFTVFDNTKGESHSVIPYKNLHVFTSSKNVADTYRMNPYDERPTTGEKYGPSTQEIQHITRIDTSKATKKDLNLYEKGKISRDEMLEKYGVEEYGIVSPSGQWYYYPTEAEAKAKLQEYEGQEYSEGQENMHVKLNLGHSYVFDAKGETYRAAISELAKENPNLAWAGKSDVGNWVGSLKEDLDGYDSLVIKNVDDNGSAYKAEKSDVYYVKNPEQIKSAETTTYDDEGNVIPLSKRFDSGKSDVRYAKKAVGGNSGVKSGTAVVITRGKGAEVPDYRQPSEAVTRKGYEHSEEERNGKVGVQAIRTGDVREIKFSEESDGFVKGKGLDIKMRDGHTYHAFVEMDEEEGEPGEISDWWQIDEGEEGKEDWSGKNIKELLGEEIFGKIMRQPRGTIGAKELQSMGGAGADEGGTHKYKTRDGVQLSMESLLEDNTDDLTELRLRKLEPGEICLVERRYEEAKQFSFTGKDKIETMDDVAYIFKQLETAAVENVFLVLVKDGKPTIIHLGMGGYGSSPAETRAAFAAYKEIDPDEVYVVHNHPSGSLKESSDDRNLLNAVQNTFGGEKVKDGIIIDTTSGKYGVFGWSDFEVYRKENEMPESVEGEMPLKVYSFSRQVFSPEWNPKEAFHVADSKSIAEFVSSHRLGEHPKMSFIVMNTQGNVVGNFFLPWTKISEIQDIEAACDELSYYVNMSGGTRGVLYGNYEYDQQDNKKLRWLVARMQTLRTPLVDVLHIDSEDDLGYHSSHDIGMMETETSYSHSEEERNGMVERAEALGAKLGTAIRVVDDVESLQHSDPEVLEKMKKAKGWYDRVSGRVTIVPGNIEDVEDAVATVMHEVVGHKGMRELVGKENYDRFLDAVYGHLTDNLKREIDERVGRTFIDGQLNEGGRSYEEVRREAVDEVIAEIAEKQPEEMNERERSLWEKICDSVRKVLDKFLRDLDLPSWVRIGENEIRYMLWRSREGLESGKESPADVLRDMAKREELGIDEQPRFSVDQEETLDDVLQDKSLSMKERIAVMKMRKARNQEDNVEAAREEASAIGAALSDIKKAMSVQRRYDRATVKSVADMARAMLAADMLSAEDMGRGDFKRLISAIKNANGKKDISGEVEKIMDIMLDSQLRRAEKTLGKMMKIKASKVDAKGVEVQGRLDVRGQRMMQAFKDARGYGEKEIEDAIAEAEERMGSDNATIADEAADVMAGLQLAKIYIDKISASKREERELRTALMDAKEDENSSQEYIASIEEALVANKAERVEAYNELVDTMLGKVGESVEAARERVEADKERIREIQHNANSDMEGRKSNEHYKAGILDKAVNNDAAQFFLAPLSTFDQMLRLFGSKSANGEGYLYNRFMRGWVDARQKELRGIRGKYEELDAKAKEIFGKGVRNWGDVIRLSGRLPKMNVSFMDGGEMVEHQLTQGNLMYIYMVNKMLDGRMKLRHMGIDEEAMKKVEKALDPRMRELADWLQEDFLVRSRNEYNETHKRMFGASMAAVEDYFPLKILKNARTQSAEELDQHDWGEGITTATGAIKRRTRNTLALDLLNADALNVLLNHVVEMEHWNAFAEFNRDLNTLRTYNKFQNRVKNMKTIYGSGDVLWDKFNDMCQMVTGSYRPPKAKLDKSAINFAKGVSAAKVSFRVFTAMKQFLSFPAYFSEARPDLLAKNLATPWNAWKWSMEHLPIFEERWKGKMAGDPRLMKSELDWEGWKNNVVQIASKIGMSPNAFVDALTVSIGAHAVYETRKARYLREGYSEEAAEKRAIQDAEIAYNQTQQSSEGAFLSTMQVDRTWASVVFSVFRNASMAYTRQLHDAVRNLSRNPRQIQASIEFMAKQMEREGVPAEKAEKAAKQRFARQMDKDALRVGIFGYLLQMCWNLGPYIPYLLMGDDDDEKKGMWKDALVHALFGGIEGYTAGDAMSQGLTMLLNGEFKADNLEKKMPLASDLKTILDAVEKGEKQRAKEGIKGFLKGAEKAALNDIINLAVQIGVGVNPQSITDAVLAIIDACGGDLKLSHEAAMCIMRILQFPQSQLDKMYFDEIGLSGDEVSQYTPAQLAERYARYKVKRGHMVTPWHWDDEDLIERKRKWANEKIKERVARFGDKEVNEKREDMKEEYGDDELQARMKELEADNKELAKQVKKARKVTKEAMAAMKDDKEKIGEAWSKVAEEWAGIEPEDYRRYKEYVAMDQQLDELVKQYLNSDSVEEAQENRKAIEEWKKKMVEELSK